MRPAHTLPQVLSSNHSCRTLRRIECEMMRLRHILRTIGWLCVVSIAVAVPALTQESKSQTSPVETNRSATPGDPATTLLPHLKDERFWISAQDNIILQYHPSFRAKYTGPNSLRPHAESATSNVG